MKTFMKKFSMVSALALSIFAVGCDAIQEPIEPRLSPNGMVVMSTTGIPYVVAEERGPKSGIVSATIGPNGGELVLGSHTLYVSAGAVDAPTKFTMRRAAEAPIRVDLQATQGSENDVGAAGFAAPVSLKLSFGSAEALPADLGNMTAIYFRPDGLVETLESHVDTGSYSITTKLPHFSLFGIAWP